MTTGGHRIGLLLDCGMGEDLIQRHIQVRVYLSLSLSRSLSDYGIGEDLIQRHIQVCVYVCLYLSLSLPLRLWYG